MTRQLGTVREKIEQTIQLDGLRRDWDDLAQLDPFWAILTEHDHRFRKWNGRSFFATGEREVEEMIEACKRIGLPAERVRALDFGCGVGRLTRPLARHFSECYGMDISPTMIEFARWLHRSVNNCHFLTNGQDNLRLFPSNHFDLVYTINVLQHLPNKAQIKSYLSEFIRTAKPGGLLVFQLPISVPMRHRIRLALSRAGYVVLKRLGVGEEFVYEKLRLSPMRMTSMPERQVISYMESIGGRVLQVQKRREIGLPQSRAYFVAK